MLPLSALAVTTIPVSGSKQLTFRKMVLRCNIDYGDIQRFEIGKINVTLLTLIELAKALEIPPKDLLDFFKEK